MAMTRLRTAAALTAAALVLAGCSAGDDQPTETAAPETTTTETSEPTPGEGNFPTPEDADRSDVDSTAETAALMLHSWDTTTDRTQTAAAVRAKPLMSKDWADSQVEPERNGAQGQWLEPAEHQAWSSPTLTQTAVPPQMTTGLDSRDDRAIRAYDVSWAWQGRDGELLRSDETSTIILFLERHDGQWEVVGHDRPQ